MGSGEDIAKEGEGSLVIDVARTSLDSSRVAIFKVVESAERQQASETGSQLGAAPWDPLGGDMDQRNPAVFENREFCRLIDGLLSPTATAGVKDAGFLSAPSRTSISRARLSRFCCRAVRDFHASARSYSWCCIMEL